MRSRVARSRIRAALLAIALTTSFGAALFVPASVALAVTCSGSGCNNTSPVTTGCATGAVTKKTAWLTNTIWPYQTLGKVELRFSATCHTVWSRVTITDDPFPGTYNVGTETIRANSVPPAIPYKVSDVDYGLSLGDSAYSPQIYLPASSSDGYTAKACGSIFQADVTNSDGCTVYWTGV